MEESNKTAAEPKTKMPKWVTAKLIFGIISMVLFALITFQSCAAGLSNILSDSGEVSGSFGFVTALNLLFSGIIAVAARKSTKKLPWIICTILLWLNLFYSRVFSGSYSDLVIWGFISFLIGVFYLLSSVKTIKGYVIVIVIAVLVFLLTRSFGSMIEKSNETSAISPIATKGQGFEVVRTGNMVRKSESATAEKAAVITASAKKETTTKATISIEELVLLDRDGIKITAKGIDTSGWFGPEIKMLFENSGNKAVTIQARHTSVNGYMINPMMSVDVAAGKKANDSLTLSSSELNQAGITTIADIEFEFHVFDSETWDTIFDSEPVRIETSAAKDYQYSFDNSGNQVFNDKGVEIVIKGLAQEDSWLGKELVVYISNESDMCITVQAKDVSVNGFMIDPVFSCDITPGKHAVDTITFMNHDLEKNEIKSIETIELSFHIANEDTWATIMDSPSVTISFD